MSISVATREDYISIIQNNELNIEESNWERVYRSIDKLTFHFHGAYGEFSDFLIQNGVDPNTMFTKSVIDGAFFESSRLRQIVIKHGVKRIGYSAFRSCDHLISITIPSSIKRICSFAFSYSPKLKEINFDGTEEEWESIDKQVKWNYNCDAEIIFLK